jgi:methionyl-tRNA formyltransferase
VTSAVVFAYHNVGVRCLSVLLAHGIEVPLVVTHRDSPGENIWFESVAALAARHAIECVAPDDPNAPAFVARIASLAPDFLFSFYYRLMLKPEVLATAARGAYNMHGSLLPKYRGRVPVNWAVIRGERETGATLHEMAAKPDAGRIVDQQSVPILPDDTALEVFGKVTVASEIVLDRALPRLIAGTLNLRDQDLAQGSYFGGRRPEDGQIDWQQPARAIHDLVRGVAPPYPGAFASLRGRTLRVLRTRVTGERAVGAAPALYARNGRCFAACSDGAVLELTSMELDGKPFAAVEFLALFGNRPITLQSSPENP